MSILQKILNLMLEPPGNLYYHLTLLFTLQILLAVSWGHWRRTGHDPGAARLLWGAGGLLLTRVVLVLAGVAAGSGAISHAAVLPPLERFMDLTALLIAAWAFLPILHQNSRLGAGFLGTGLLSLSLLYVFSATTWPADQATGVSYNAHWQAQVWELAGILLAALSILALVIWPRAGLGLLSASLTAWLAGHLAQLLLPSSAPHLAGATRLANLIAVPLLTALAFQEALRQGAPAATPAAAVPPDRGMRLFKIARRVEQAQDPETALASVLRDIARYLTVDTAAIGLPAVGDTPGVRIVGLYPTRRSHLPQLSLQEEPLLAAAARTRQPQYDAGTDQQAAPLRSLGFQEPGPLLVEPLVQGKEVLGLLLLGNPKSKQPLSETTVEQAHSTAEVLATALANARRRLAAEQKVERLTASLRQREAERADRTATLQGELEQAREDAQKFAKRVIELEQEAARQQKRADELAELLHLREEHAGDLTATQVAAYEEELGRLREGQEAIQAELEQWKQRAQQLEQQRAELEQRLDTAQAQAAPTVGATAVGGTLVADERGNIILADRGAQRLLGYSQDDLLGAPLHAVFSDPVWVQTVKEMVIDQSRDGASTTITFQRDGSLVQAELTRMTTSAEEPTNLIAVLRPEAAQDDRSEIIASLANDLRTPMTSIVGYTDLLLSESVGILGEMQQKFLQRVKANIERLSGAINDLVEVTAIDTGRIELTPEPVDIITIIEGAIMGLSAQFSERDLTVRLDMALELPPVEVDRDSLHQIMHHLLSNAYQCSQPGTEIVVTGHLEEKVEKGLPSFLRVSVADTGGGIEPEDQPRVFQRLYRADRPLIAGLGETGVGMAIAKTLVEANGGRIWVESKMGVGSTFSFILPVSSPTHTTKEKA